MYLSKCVLVIYSVLYATTNTFNQHYASLWERFVTLQRWLFTFSGYFSPKSCKFSVSVPHRSSIDSLTVARLEGCRAIIEHSSALPLLRHFFPSISPSDWHQRDASSEAHLTFITSGAFSQHHLMLSPRRKQNNTHQQKQQRCCRQTSPLRPSRRFFGYQLDYAAFITDVICKNNLEMLLWSYRRSAPSQTPRLWRWRWWRSGPGPPASGWSWSERPPPRS